MENIVFSVYRGNEIAYEFFFQQFIIYLNKGKNTNLLIPGNHLDWPYMSIVTHIGFIYAVKIRK